MNLTGTRNRISLARRHNWNPHTGGSRMSTSYHIYFQEKVLFKNLTLSEFTLIDKLYTSYWKEDITYAECVDDACVNGTFAEHSY